MRKRNTAIDADPLSKKVEEKKSALVRLLLEWGRENSPAYPWRKDTSPYNILVSELLLRKTRADRVSEIFPVFLDRFPSMIDLSRTSPEKIRRVIHSLGRVKRDRDILDIARSVIRKHAGVIPHSERDLFALIGKQSRYTVNAIRCFAYGERVPIFDVNVNRILSRVFSLDFGNQSHKNDEAWQLAQLLLPDKKIKEFNWALLDLGRKVCISNPRCEICPLLDVCDFGRDRKPTLKR